MYIEFLLNSPTGNEIYDPFDPRHKHSLGHQLCHSNAVSSLEPVFESSQRT